MTLSHQAGGPVVPEVPASAIRIPTIVAVVGDKIQVFNNVEQLNETSEQIQKIGSELTKQLTELHKLVRQRAPDDWKNEADLDDALELDKDWVDDLLLEWRKPGVSLRRTVSSTVRVLQNRGYLRSKPERQHPITFTEVQNPAQSRHPIWWELIYEGSITEQPDWSRFWGFWVPITHWLIGEEREGSIQLDSGFFTAVHDKLPFAPFEAERLQNQLHIFKDRYQGMWHYMSLDMALRKNLHDKITPEIYDDKQWLNRFLTAYPKKSERITMISEQMRSIFRDSPFPYNLIHFACHCDPSNGPQILAKLEMQTGGETITLDALLMDEWSRKTEWDYWDPGALVFLNACGTAETNASEPPIFPVKWIKCQGALAVIATLCPIPDYFAFAFAQKFYSFLFEAIAEPDKPEKAIYAYVAEALMATRRHFLEKYNNPLGLAYILYATDNARIVLPTLKQEGA